MDWFLFHHPTDNFGPFVRWREKIFGRAEDSLYNQRTHFSVLSEKSFEGGGTPPALSLQKVLSLFNGQNESECHDFVSRALSPLLYNGHFSSKTWHPLSKNFSCP